MNNFITIDRFFDVLKLSLLAIAGVYLFKRFLLPEFKKKLALERAAEQDLHQKRQDLLNDQKLMHEKEKAQEQLCDDLKNKINIWNTTFHEVFMQDNAQAQERIERLQQKLALQSTNYEKQKLKEQLTPSVIEYLKNDLTLYYKNSKNAQAYTSHVLGYIKKNNS